MHEVIHENFGALNNLMRGHLSPQPLTLQKMASTGDIGSLLWKLKFTHEGASLYLLLGPDLEGGVAGAKDAPSLT